MFTEPPQISPVHAALLGGQPGGGFLPPRPPVQPGIAPMVAQALLAALLGHPPPGQHQSVQPGQHEHGFLPPGQHDHTAGGAPGFMPGLRPPPVFQPPGQPVGAGVHFQPALGAGLHLPQPQPAAFAPGPGPIQPTVSPGMRPAPGGLNDGPNQPAQPYPGPGLRPLPRYQPPIRRY